MSDDHRSSLFKKGSQSQVHQSPAMCDKVTTHPQLGILPTQEVGFSLLYGYPSLLTLEEN